MSGLGVGLPQDEDEVLVQTGSVPTKDPYRQLPLAKEDNGYPLSLPCGHTYNRSTILSKKKNSNKWTLEKCAGMQRPRPFSN